MSFSAEIKDFINGLSAGQKINASRTDQEYKDALTDSTKKKTERENDPDTLALQDQQARANLAKTQAGIRQIGASTAYTNARAQHLRELRAQGAVPVGSGLVDGYPGMAPAGAGAVAAPPPQFQSTMEPELEYAEGGAVPEYPRADDNAFFASGRDEKIIHAKRKLKARFEEDGKIYPLNQLMDRRAAEDTVKRVRGYADGGAVPMDDEEDMAEPAALPSEMGATPAVGGAVPAGAGDTDFSSANRRDPNKVPAGLQGIVSPQLVHDATKAGLTWGAEAFGLTKSGGIRSSTQKLAAQRFAAGQGGLTPAEMEAVKKAVDPQGKLSESQRNMAALGSVYQYQLNKGNPEGAQRVAFQMLQHYRVAAQRYAAIAKQAADNGDLDTATKAAVKAYANVPDGRDMALTKDDDGNVVYSFTDENGKTILKGVATPQQLAASAMGMATNGFDKAILMAAGARENPKAATGGKAPSARDRKTLDEMATEPVTAARDAWQEKNKDAKPDEEYWGDVTDTTKHILSENPKATPREAFKAAQALHTLDKDDPGKTSFKIIPGEGDDKISTIKFNNGLKVQLDDDQLEQVLIARAARLKKRDAADDAKQDAEEDGGPGIMDRLGAVGTAIGSALNTSPKIFPGGTGGALPVDEEPAPRPERQYTPYIPPQSSARRMPAVE